ncbi:hypothetical protein TUMSATVNIG1_61000 (plasmid) [Vibrio nigripulchritudo]|uniref:hypothetical protein n=1 Tax=Vibrio nigripulchritudo TaxID=28173 RepID=UPI00190D0428|nr:hypothetical protein [Vibrio nigripulchritudo]BCL74116.1 hypothetical protein VNTUMSATTG_60530 [Vibrio nigripulchritudo]BDU35491.1 hypothetical protein TUMSATVNIG1_61000 [Vibrio nigripulchritudo]
MYFMKVKVPGKQDTYYGPYILKRSNLLSLANKGCSGLSKEDCSVLNNAAEETTLYAGTIVQPGETLILRDSLSISEYKAVYDLNRSLYSVKEFAEIVGITPSVHTHILGGRKAITPQIVKPLTDLCVSHSFIHELTGLSLAGMTLNGKAVSSMKGPDFGHFARHLLRELRDSPQLALRYYWSKRSHIELCSLYTTMQSQLERESLGTTIDRFAQSPEHYAQKAATVSNRGSKLNLTEEEKVNLMSVLKASQDGTPISRKQVEDCLTVVRSVGVEALRNEGLSVVGLNAEEVDSAIESILTPDKGASVAEHASESVALAPEESEEGMFLDLKV